MKELIKQVEQWAEDKGILTACDCIAQLEKTEEEVDELYEEIHRIVVGSAFASEDRAKLEMGDVLVTLIIQCKMQGWDAQECLQKAYDKISKRTGQLIDGVFVKSEDL